MRRLTWGMIAIVLALPGPAVGQAIKPADFVGTWMHRYDLRGTTDSLRGLVVDYWKVDSNGTYAYNDREGSTGEESKGSWSLAADTLRLGRDDSSDSAAYNVVLRDGRLFLWRWEVWAADRGGEQCADQVWERFDSLKALAFPPPPPITIQPADLVGTWAGTFSPKEWGTLIDTLVIGADYSLKSVHVGPPDDYFIKGTWALLPGDVLAGALAGSPAERDKIYLRNGELVRCSLNHPVMKRVAP